jgi:hypothetical protein
MRQNSAASDRWFTFAAPTQWMKRVEDYVAGVHDEREEDAEREKGGDPEKQQPQRTPRRAHSHGLRVPLPRHHDPYDLSVNQTQVRSSRAGLAAQRSRSAQTPGWSAPWQPFRRNHSGYSQRQEGPSEGPSTKMIGNRARAKTWLGGFSDFLLHNAFAPLVLRTLNLSITAALLAVAVRIQVVEMRNNLVGIIGSRCATMSPSSSSILTVPHSTIMAIVVGVMTILHVLVQSYVRTRRACALPAIEPCCTARVLWRCAKRPPPLSITDCRAAPIGIWRLKTKMAHTLVELLFIVLVSRRRRCDLLAR